MVQVFSYQKSHFGYVLEGLESIGIKMPIWYILRPLGRFYERLVYFAVDWNIFSNFGMFCKETSGNPGTKSRNCQHFYPPPLSCF
jgi:hypothetical protein